MDMQNSLLALDAQAFLGALDELGIEGEQRNFLLREKRKYDSPFGGLMDFGAVPEGQKRATILPMVSPEGMTGWDAITSGQAQLALPSFITGAVEGAARAIDLPRASLAMQVPPADLESEAMNMAGMASLGAASTAGAGLFDYDPNTTRVFAGPRAATADLEALERAKRLSAAKADPDTIWNQTGWFKLGDKKWRFEIPDNDVALRRPEDAAQLATDMTQQANDILAGIRQRNADLKVQPDLFPQTIRQDNAILKRKADTLAKRASGNYGPTWNPATLGQRGTYAITDSELQRAYPDLMFDTIVRTDQNLGGAFGSYDEGMKQLNLATDSTFMGAANPLSRDKRKTLLHELQHAIQGYENLARGASPASAKELLMNLRDADIKIARDRQGELFKQASPEVKELLTQRFYARQSGDEAAFDEANRQLEGMPLGADIIAADNAAREAANRTITSQDAYDAYQRHLGELEARLAAERAGWTVGERKAVPPWRMETFIPDDRVIKSFELSPRYPNDIFTSADPARVRGFLE